MCPRPSSLDRILDAAERIVLEQGASRMTMDAVAARARVSKGGLIYHYPSLHHLLTALMTRFMTRMEGRRTRALAEMPPGPAGRLKAYIQTFLTLGNKERHSAAALLATITREPELLARVRRRDREVWAEIAADAPAPEHAMILALAVKGMWMSELLGVSSLTAAKRRRLQDALLLLADEWCSPSAKSATGSPPARDPGIPGTSNADRRPPPRASRKGPSTP